MTFWNASQVITIDDGVTANDGTGDSIRTAFTKVNENFSNISAQLSQPSQDWLNANVSYNTNLNYATVANLFVANLLGNTANFIGNISSGNLIANIGFYSNGPTHFASNVYTSANIIPTVSGLYNLGTPSLPFGNLYVQTTISTTQVTNATTAGLFFIHANTSQTDTQDVGIFGNISNDYNQTNTYAFFGHQFSTNNFIYKITPVNTTSGNNIVVGGVYGNVQFGSALLSNTTPSTSTTTGALIVNGGAGINGNLFVASNIYSYGFQVLTTNTIGMTLYSGDSAFTGNLVTTSITPSISTSTGALILSYGGAGIAGNVNAGGNVVATGLVGPLYGTVQTAAQPNITSLGTLTNGLQIGAGQLSVPSVNITGIGVSGGAPLVVAAAGGLGANITGNIWNSSGGITSAANIVTTNYFVGNISSPQINLLNANISAANANIAATYTSITNAWQANAAVLYTDIQINNSNDSTLSSGVATLNANLGAYQIYANATLSTHNATLSTLNANLGAYQIYANATLSTLNANLGTLYLGNISTNANLGAYQIYANGKVSSLQTQINSLATGANANTAAYLPTYTGTIQASSLLPTGNVTNNIGSSTLWWNSIYGTSIHAQYADLAEIYVADAEYIPGTVVVFGGDKEITVTTQKADSRVAGVISTNPAYLMNQATNGLPVALRGRVPVQIIGPVMKGDGLITADIAGYAVSIGTQQNYGQAVFAKSLTTDAGTEQRIIEAVII